MTSCCTENQWRVKFHAHAAIQTYELFGQGQYATRSTNEDQPMKSRHRRCSAFGQQNGTCMRVTVLPDLILYRTLITNTFKFKHTNVRAVGLAPTRHPLFHTFSKRRSTQSRHCQCSACIWWAWHYDHILHRTPMTPSNPSTHTTMQTYELFVQYKHDTRSIRATNED